MMKIKIKPAIIITVLITSFFINSIFASEKSTTKKQKAPAFSYSNIENTKKFSPADFTGKYLLLDFWASWCPPCKAAAPELKRLYTEYSDKEFEILGISIDGDEQAWKKKVAEKGFEWTNIIAPDKGKSVSALYGFNAIPYFVLIDPEGNIIDKGFSINDLPELLKKTIKDNLTPQKNEKDIFNFSSNSYCYNINISKKLRATKVFI